MDKGKETVFPGGTKEKFAKWLQRVKEEESIKENPPALESYCPWCVGKEKALELQKLGQTGKVCPDHQKEFPE